MRRLMRSFVIDSVLGTTRPELSRHRHAARSPQAEDIAEAIERNRQKLIEGLKSTASDRHERVRKRRIAKLLVRRLEKGNSLEQIEQEAKLNISQRRFMHLFVIQHKPYKEISALISCKRSYISLLCQITLNKLKGEKPLSHLFKRYQAMQEDALLALMRKFRKRHPEGRLSNSDYPLYRAAVKRGLYAKVFPEKQPKSLDAIQAELKKLRAEKPLAEICAMLKLTKIQKEILQQAESGIFKQTPYFTKKYRIQPYELYFQRFQLLRKLRGWEPSHGETRKDLEEIIRNMPDGQCSDFIAQLPERYQIVLRDRVLIHLLDGKEPASLDEIGIKLGIGRERVRQIQNQSIKYAHKFIETGRIKKAKPPERVKRAHRGRPRKYEGCSVDELLKIIKRRKNDKTALRELERRNSNAM